MCVREYESGKQNFAFTLLNEKKTVCNNCVIRDLKKKSKIIQSVVIFNVYH